MTTYEVTAWCNVPYYATFELKAANLAEALKKAKLRAKKECGEPCGGDSEWDEFEIMSVADAAQYLRHLEPAWLASIAALDLRDALQAGIQHAQAIALSWQSGDLAGAVRALSEWLPCARDALAKATHS
jgi:hypothetical protein